jgi:transglutaminase-like putative cysteine protease
MDADLAAEAPEGKPTTSNDPADFLGATYYIDCDDPTVKAHAEKVTESLTSDKEKAIALFYSVRDGIRYDPYTTKLDAAGYKASETLKDGVAWCVPKGILMTALCRAVGISARPGYADVQNHLCTPKVREMMGTDIFSYHGYCEMFLDGKWVKATPVFNVELCDKFGVLAQDFDGENDALLQPFDKNGNKHMDYLKDHGTYNDMPFKEIMDDFDWRYKGWMDFLREKAAKAAEERGDFHAEAAAEGKSV